MQGRDPLLVSGVEPHGLTVDNFVEGIKFQPADHVHQPQRVLAQRQSRLNQFAQGLKHLQAAALPLDHQPFLKTLPVPQVETLQKIAPVEL